MPLLTQRLARAADTAMDRLVVLGYTRIGHAVRRRLPHWPADPAPDALAGRHVAVTGATSGLGEATARGASDLGAHVHLVVRDTDKGERVAAALPAPGRVTVWHCDGGDLDSVRAFTNALLAQVPRLDGLVHNAGALPATRTESPQGHELTMALHVLGPVAMTEALRPVLSAGAPVIFVTSGGMYAQRLRADDPDYHQQPYSGATAYARSKRAQVELLPLLQRRWVAEGESGPSVHAAHPGWADSPGLTSSLPRFARVTAPILRSPEAGADTVLWLLARPGQPGGQLWHDRRPRPTHVVSRTRVERAEAARLWRWVVGATGLEDTDSETDS
ncbi:SDR family NAD(P)-dependent oxidoreductase [Ornithinimicrobium faecis]|uniref:SDR family NAD(P)-dependent oxidoreductase n=1 Tax=Ornithinimicrobium faecis TaxID=2934158 RepID=A0ABY4YVA0_9MICO|nr:SDR family NAD(P)-dependent oxidoreductase [Ornithinimicrobium sp. HY1793]USQ80665.1 SDR family NAD(P)-dependent oxidoreductase [Ornithinimicrobium sp. HY1793]